MWRPRDHQLIALFNKVSEPFAISAGLSLSTRYLAPTQKISITCAHRPLIAFGENPTRAELKRQRPFMSDTLNGCGRHERSYQPLFRNRLIYHRIESIIESGSDQNIHFDQQWDILQVSIDHRTFPKPGAPSTNNWCILDVYFTNLR